MFVWEVWGGLGGVWGEAGGGQGGVWEVSAGLSRFDRLSSSLGTWGAFTLFPAMIFVLFQ